MEGGGTERLRYQKSWTVYSMMEAKSGKSGEDVRGMEEGGEMRREGCNLSQPSLSLSLLFGLREEEAV